MMRHTGTPCRQTIPHIPTFSSFPPVLCCSPRLVPRVNPMGQCCPTERQACWPGKHCPLVGLVLTGLQPVSGSQFHLGERVMRVGSSNQSRDRLTKSSRLLDFCSSSNIFYGRNSSMGLSSPCTHRCVDHPTVLCLIRSPTCSFGPLLPS